MAKAKLVATSSGEMVPSGEYVWITTTSDLDSIYPDEKPGPGGWFPFSVVDLHSPDPQMNSCVVLWRTAILKKELPKRIESEEEDEFPTIMSRVEIYAEARDIDTEKALDELLSLAMDGYADVPPEELRSAYEMSGFVRKL